MSIEDIKQITGKSEQEIWETEIARLESTNPAAAKILKNHPPVAHTANSDAFVITDEMRAGARANEAFHKPRLQGEVNESSDE